MKIRINKRRFKNLNDFKTAIMIQYLNILIGV